MAEKTVKPRPSNKRKVSKRITDQWLDVRLRIRGDGSAEIGSVLKLYNASPVTMVSGKRIPCRELRQVPDSIRLMLSKVLPDCTFRVLPFPDGEEE